MKKLLYFLPAFCFLACSGPNTPEEPAEVPAASQLPDLTSELAKIEELRNGFSKAVAEKRYDDLGQFTHSDLKAIGPASAEWLKYRELREAQTGLFSYDSIRMHPYETMLVNDSMAYDFGWSSVYYTDPDGNPVEINDTFLVLLKKRNGKWKLWREVGSGRVDNLPE
jgi:ketosteroid isomerase-like protein